MKYKVLVVNKYHFISGGAERYFLSVMESFRQRDIEPIPLSVNYSRTLPTPYQKYFIEPILKNGAAKIQMAKPAWKEQAALAGRAIYSQAAKKAVQQIYHDHKPDIAYFLNFNNHISPSAIDACSEAGIPVVMRMSDFNLVCASNMYYRDGHGPCTDCKSGLHHAVINRCVHGSLVRSFAQVLANSFHRLSGVYKKVSAFVAPTEFMRQDLIELGFPAERIHQVNTFAKPCDSDVPEEKQKPYILFVGRFVPYKGVEASIRAFAKLPASYPVSLYLAGDEDDEESRRLKRIASELAGGRIVFLPFERDKKKLHDLVHRSLFTLVPSEFYENLPNTILESFACGRPVVATRLGSLPDIVEDGKLGLLFEYGNLDDFSEKMRWLLDHPSEREQMGRNARQAIVQDYSEEKHVEKILNLFDSLRPQPASVLV
jgi:glycosyltransferase involved in cell wall biosynthesis